MKILLIEDDKVSRITLGDAMIKEGYKVIACEKGLEGLEWLEEDSFDVVITDLRLPDISGLDIVKAAKERNKESTVIVITGYATVETAVNALKLGAFDYFEKPFSPDRLMSMLKNVSQYQEIMRENQQLKKRIIRYESREILGNSVVMQKLVTLLRSVASTDHTILIEGESGTGKELVAHYLHQHSDRSKGPFVPVNCAVLPEGLLESELFGHEKGAFTGAHRRHQGYIERAHGGTLFIDDIDDMPLSLQVKLLRVLQEHEVQPVGARQAIYVNFRVVCATKVNLYQMVLKGSFREDLYYRLNIISIAVPPLRERKEDLPILIDYFIKKHYQGDNPPKITPDKLTRMMQYDWPGNVRELENIVQRMLALPQDVDFMQMTHASAVVQSVIAEAPAGDADFEKSGSFDAYMEKREREIIEWAMAKAANNISHAARLLNLPRSTLQSKLEKKK